jgi:stringent starvation protein B
MTTVVPYLLRAYHQWIEDSGLTPHVLVNCTIEGVIVPNSFVQEDKIILNISYGATDSLVIGNDNISFKARFGDRPMSVTVPIVAVLSVYAGENGEGMFFGPKEGSAENETKPNLKLID